MISTHSLKRALIAIIATSSLLFMQLAAAAYVCAGTAGSAPEAMNMAPCSKGASSGCRHLDTTRIALCTAQAYASNEITSVLRIPKLPVVTSNAWFAAFSVVADSDEFRQPSPHAPPGLTRAIFPSLSIRNCCYRI